jgi:hypothetical protein
MPARSLWRLQLVLAVAAAVKPPGIRSPRLTRRSLLAAAPAACALAVMPPVPAARAASLTAELREAEAALAASDGSTVLASINRLLELSSEYGGMPSDALRKELIEKVWRELSASGPAPPAAPRPSRWRSRPAWQCRARALATCRCSPGGEAMPAAPACGHGRLVPTRRRLYSFSFPLSFPIALSPSSHNPTIPTGYRRSPKLSREAS